MHVTDWPSLPGAYVLLIRIDAPLEVSLGTLPTCRLPAGLYAYVGSAHGPGGLRARLSRHVRPVKRLHWHVDYLTGQAPVVAVLPMPGTEPRECACLRALLALPGASVPLRGFGSSDCRSGCPAHLLRLPDSVVVAELEERLRLCAKKI